MRQVILLFIGLIFLSCKSNSSSTPDAKAQSENITSEYENKKKELELKEKELDLKEKEMKLNSKLNRIPSEEAKVFIENWASIQTNKAIDSYSRLYSDEFQGIKKTKTGKTSFYNYSEWMNDRRKMYSSAKNLSISAYDISVVSFDPNSAETKVQFTQYYYSDSYSDEGMKIMHLKRGSSGEIKIIKEEMVYSGEITEGC